MKIRKEFGLNLPFAQVLGVEINSDLKFDEFLEAIINAAKSAFFYIYRNIQTSNIYILEMQFTTCVLPVIEYASPMLCFMLFPDFKNGIWFPSLN